MEILPIEVVNPLLPANRPILIINELPEVGIEKNEEPIKEIGDDFDFNQDNLIEDSNEYRSPGWARLKKKLSKW